MKIQNIDNEIIEFKLKNGLNVSVITSEYATSFNANFVTKYGSNDLKVNGKEIPHGIAHFLEHVMFASETGDFFSKYDKYNGSANAYTTYNHTNYLFKSSEYFYENLNILIELVTTSYFTQEVVKKEFEIISEEILMYEKQPTTKLNNLIYNSIATNTNYKYDIAGTIDDISKITPELLQEVYDYFYTPQNQHLILYGNINIDELKSFLEEKFNSSIKEYISPEILIENSNINEEINVIVDDTQDLDIAATTIKFNYPIENNEQMQHSLSVFARSLFDTINKNYFKKLEQDYLPDCYPRVTYYKDIFALIIRYEGDDTKRYHDNIVEYLKSDYNDIIENVIKSIKSSIIYSIEDLEEFSNIITRFIAEDRSITDFFDSLYNLEKENVINDIQKMFEDYNITYSAVVREKENN